MRLVQQRQGAGGQRGRHEADVHPTVGELDAAGSARPGVLPYSTRNAAGIGVLVAGVRVMVAARSTGTGESSGGGTITTPVGRSR
jgi:hypothetical protein